MWRRIVGRLVWLATAVSTVICVAAVVAWAASFWRSDRLAVTDWTKVELVDPIRAAEVWLTQGEVVFAGRQCHYYFTPQHVRFSLANFPDGYVAVADGARPPHCRLPDAAAALIRKHRLLPGVTVDVSRREFDDENEYVQTRTCWLVCPDLLIVAVAAVLPAATMVGRVRRQTHLTSSTATRPHQRRGWSRRNAGRLVACTPAILLTLTVVALATSFAGRKPEARLHVKDFSSLDDESVLRDVLSTGSDTPSGSEVDLRAVAKSFNLSVERGRVGFEYFRQSLHADRGWVDWELVTDDRSHSVWNFWPRLADDRSAPAGSRLDSWSSPERSTLGVRWRTDVEQRVRSRVEGSQSRYYVTRFDVHRYWSVPILYPLCLLAGLVGAQGRHMLRRRRGRRWATLRRCGGCGYDWRSSPGRCPECGLQRAGTP